ncbi:MAG: hypothetical protein MAG715_00544 [Methanonatronarchaeales archaeon]|nr:hypothetical protein [Methanonatronarchaeales archaeon]
MNVKRYRNGALLLAGLGALYVAINLPRIYSDLLWFSSLGYTPVYLEILLYRVALFATFAVATFAAVWIGIRTSSSRVHGTGYSADPSVLGGVTLVSVLVGLGYSRSWDTVLRYLNGSEFGKVDPVHGRAVSFYVFDLPLYRLVTGFLLFATVLSLAVAVAVYAVKLGFEVYEEAANDPVSGAGTTVEFELFTFLRSLRRNALGHISGYAGVLLLLAAIHFYLARFELLYSPSGAVYGVGAVDAALIEPLLTGLAVISVGAAAVNFVNVRMKDPNALYATVAAVVLIMLLGNLAGGLYQSYVVEPDEFNNEESFIENEIEFTRSGFALDEVRERQFSVSDTLTREQVDANPGTIDNVRLWDYRPLLKTYNELQIFRTYYRFNDVDIDRYEIGGRDRAVMVSAREVDLEALTAESRSWVNRHLVYTHGFGATMSPVSNVSAEGLPELYVKDIPPNSTAGIPIDQPRIYYGESTDAFAVVNTGTRELDYPGGERNVYTSYSGRGGVELDTFTKKLSFAVRQGSPQILLSDSITPESRIQVNRDIETRARTLAPFLKYDDDPYVVASGGDLYWIYDAYTTTSRYPYSRPTVFKGESTNYVRNSVKVVVNAHSGETTLYVSDPDDPVIETYRNEFPSLFRDMDEMPEDLMDHVRYPEDAFQAQAQVYLNYHMTDPKVFYNKEDAWRIPDEITRGERTEMEPYYLVMKLPGEDRPEFVQIWPFIPRGRENMIGWLAARSDTPNYGKLEAFLFSKQRLAFGPMQIESRIDQDADISQMMTLWSQSGSRVIRGNLLAIPVEDTILYIEPLYLESRETGSIPELKRVIVAHGDQLTMQPTLEGSLGVLFGEAEERRPGPVDRPGTLAPGDLDTLRTLYDEARAALQRGDLATYADRVEEMGKVLEEAGNSSAAR